MNNNNSSWTNLKNKTIKAKKSSNTVIHKKNLYSINNKEDMLVSNSFVISEKTL